MEEFTQREKHYTLLDEANESFFNLVTKFDICIETGPIKPIVIWNRFEDVKPDGDSEYFVCTNDKVIKVSYFDGQSWGYTNKKEHVILWSPLPEIPII